MTTLAYRLFFQSNIIYQFSKHGILPRNESKRRLLITLIGFSVFAGSVIVIYIILNIVFLKAGEIEKDDKLTNFFKGFRLGIHVADLIMFTLALHRITYANIKARDRDELAYLPLVIIEVC